MATFNVAGTTAVGLGEYLYPIKGHVGGRTYTPNVTQNFTFSPAGINMFRVHTGVSTPHPFTPLGTGTGDGGAAAISSFTFSTYGTVSRPGRTRVVVSETITTFSTTLHNWTKQSPYQWTKTGASSFVLSQTNVCGRVYKEINQNYNLIGLTFNSAGDRVLRHAYALNKVSGDNLTFTPTNTVKRNLKRSGTSSVTITPTNATFFGRALSAQLAIVMGSNGDRVYMNQPSGGTPFTFSQVGVVGLRKNVSAAHSFAVIQGGYNV